MSPIPFLSLVDALERRKREALDAMAVSEQVALGSGSNILLHIHHPPYSFSYCYRSFI